MIIKVTRKADGFLVQRADFSVDYMTRLEALAWRLWLALGGRRHDRAGGRDDA